MPVRLADNIEYSGRPPKKRRVQPSGDIAKTASYNNLQNIITQACDGITAYSVDINTISDNLKDRISTVEEEIQELKNKKHKRIKSIKVRI